MNKTVQAMVKTLHVDASVFYAGPLAWLETVVKQFPECNFAWLLAHAEDEVAWGRVEKGKVRLSREGDLRAATLIECRLFSEQAELLVWQAEDRLLRARLVVEDASVDRIDEYQILWGSRTDRYAPAHPQGFTPLVEVAQNGMRHCVPLPVSDADLTSGRLRLRVRHYLACDDQTGEACVVLSRLAAVGLFTPKEIGEVEK